MLDEICERDFKHSLCSLDSKETCLLPYSSGTTGLPKGVELTHHNLVANLSQICHPGLRISLDTTRNQQDVLPLFLPMFHIYGLTAIMLSMLSQGCKLVTFPKYGTEALIKFCKEHKPNIIHAVPPISKRSRMNINHFLPSGFSTGTNGKSSNKTKVSGNC